MAVDVEEFFNRVHNTNDGRFGTSGTGGGHYAGRAKGAKRPSLKSGGGKGAPPPPPKSSGGNGFPKPTPGGKANAPRPLSDFKKAAAAGQKKPEFARSVLPKDGKTKVAGNLAKSSTQKKPEYDKTVVYNKGSAARAKSDFKKDAPKRDINAEAKAHVAGLMAKHSADRAARKEANKDKPAQAPRKEGGDTAKLNDIQKLRQHLKDNPDKSNDRGIIAKGKDTSNDKGIVSKGKDTSNDRGILYKPAPAGQKKPEFARSVLPKDGKTKVAGNLAKSSTQKKPEYDKTVVYNKGSAARANPAGPKPAQNKQDAAKQVAAVAKKVKVPLSERVRTWGKIAQKFGDGVLKDNMSGGDWKAYKQRTDPSHPDAKAHLTVRSAFLTGRQQR